MRSWRTLYLRRQRRERAERFKRAHALNTLLWTLEEVWPKMAVSGPWAGLAEDLSKECLTAADVAGDGSKSFKQAF